MQKTYRKGQIPGSRKDKGDTHGKQDVQGTKEADEEMNAVVVRAKEFDGQGTEKRNAYAVHPVELHIAQRPIKGPAIIEEIVAGLESCSTEPNKTRIYCSCQNQKQKKADRRGAK